MPENNPLQNKLQIRAKLLTAVVSLQSNSQDVAFIKQTLDELKEIADREAVLDILLKEFLKENTEIKDFTISFLIKELIETEKIEAAFFETLANPKIKDGLKAKIIGALRELGKHVNYEQYVTYFENPDEIIDADTIRLLENAKVNPESQIDFLDFLNALPEPEKDMLIESLTNDYDGDNLTNILIPLILSNPYSDHSKKAIKAIGESKSYLAYPVLKYLSDTIDDPEICAVVQKSFSLLKFSGVKEDITKDYYKKLLAVTPVHKCFANFPDGHGNTGLIFSRKSENDLIQMFTAVVNDSDGIIDCFGFNEISEAEFERIIGKFFTNDIVTEVSPEFCKFMLTNAEKITRLKYKEVSYEYIAWNTITKDIPYEEIDLSLGVEKIEPSEFILKRVYDKNYFEKWFFELKDSEEFAALIDEITENKINTANEVETLISDYKNKIYNANVRRLLNYRLLLSAYLLKQSGEDAFSGMVHSLIDESDVKEKFITDIIKKSVYEFFLSQKDKYEMTKSAKSIFSRRANKENENIDIKFIEQCIKEIEKNWV